MSRPIDLKNEIEKIKNKTIINQQDLSTLYSMIEPLLPKPHVHGKKCKNTSCHHRMNGKSIKCPMCHTEMRKRKRQTCSDCKHGQVRPIYLKCGCRMCFKCKKTYSPFCRMDSWRFRCSKSTPEDPHYHVLPCKKTVALASKIEDKNIFNRQSVWIMFEAKFQTPCTDGCKRDMEDCCAFAKRYLDNEPTFADKENMEYAQTSEYRDDL